jgi:tRNA-2-methylthio-N6-dimethylallyladenosine synthase
MNVSDSEIITTILKNSGFEPTEHIGKADIIMFNTCSIRENAESRVIGRISNEISRKMQNKNIIIGVVGCMAQRLGDELGKINKHIDFVVGVDQYDGLPEIINTILIKREFTVSTEFDSLQIYDQIYPTRFDALNAFVTITRGCDNYCSYCIVPYTRGRERSRPLSDILKEVRIAGENKAYDITLLGQNVNSYSFQGLDFPDLLMQINDIDTIRRIRFITSHPKDLSDKLIETMAKCENVCEHIHLPMQSANDEILHRMNRKYTASHYKSLITKLRKIIPNIAITTDIIVGFPGETDAQYNDTFEMMREIEFDSAFMFKYSERSGTKAVDLDGSVAEGIRLDRLQRVIDLQTEITTKKYKDKIGSIQEVYVEAVSKRDKNEMSGKTRDFKITVFEGNSDLINKFLKVQIYDAVGWTLKGKIIDEVQS